MLGKQVGHIKNPAGGGMLGLPYFVTEDPGVAPDSGKTVLRSRLGLNYRQLPTSERSARARPLCRNRLPISILRCGM